MKIFVDEDTGAGIGRALVAVGVQADYVSSSRAIRPGTPDEIWIPWAGRQGSLVLSRNVGILQTEAQRALLVVSRVGMVFLPQHLTAFELLRLLLWKWDWLEALDAGQPRPFAYRMAPGGRTARLRFPQTSKQALGTAAVLVSRMA